MLSAINAVLQCSILLLEKDELDLSTSDFRKPMLQFQQCGVNN